jgi:hypothetical protein
LDAGGGDDDGGDVAMEEPPPTQVVDARPAAGGGAAAAAAAAVEGTASAHHMASSSMARTDPRLDDLMEVIHRTAEAVQAEQTGPSAPGSPPGDAARAAGRAGAAAAAAAVPPPAPPAAANARAGGTPGRRGSAYARALTAGGVTQLLQAGAAATGCLALARSQPRLEGLRQPGGGGGGWAPFNVVLLGFEPGAGPSCTWAVRGPPGARRVVACMRLAQ